MSLFSTDFKHPSSTTTAAGVAAAVMTALWAVYDWIGVGPEATPAVVSLTTGAVAALTAWMRKEEYYEMREREGSK